MSASKNVFYYIHVINGPSVYRVIEISHDSVYQRHVILQRQVRWNKNLFILIYLVKEFEDLSQKVVGFIIVIITKITRTSSSEENKCTPQKKVNNIAKLHATDGRQLS